ncbi:MAG: PT domain-containing protein [Clostridiales bacterium]|nr:PT domain-containing protein [Clostridiales bacterium]
MKNSVIKTITLLLIAAMLITAFAACKTPEAPVDNSPAPTEQQAEAPTEAPTEEPTAAPSPATTATPVPEPVILSFEERAEEILRLRPYKADDGPLPDDAADDEVLYINDSPDDLCAWGPLLWAVDGDTKVICDMGEFPIRGLFVYGEDNTLLSRKTIWHPGDRLAALSDGILFTLEGIYDINTGELLKIVKLPDNEDFWECRFLQTERLPKLVGGESEEIDKVYTIFYSYYELNDGSGEIEASRGGAASAVYCGAKRTSDNAGYDEWKKTDLICKVVEDYYGKWTKVTLQSGAEFTFDGGGYEPMGIDLEGNYYFWKMDVMDGIIKVAPSGAILSELEIPIDKNDLWEPGIKMTLSEDGTIMIAAALWDAFVIWKVTM